MTTEVGLAILFAAALLLFWDERRRRVIMERQKQAGERQMKVIDILTQTNTLLAEISQKLDKN